MRAAGRGPPHGQARRHYQGRTPHWPASRVGKNQLVIPTDEREYSKPKQASALLSGHFGSPQGHGSRRPSHQLTSASISQMAFTRVIHMPSSTRFNIALQFFPGCSFNTIDKYLLFTCVPGTTTCQCL